jgi:hypothetical protein
VVQIEKLTTTTQKKATLFSLNQTHVEIEQNGDSHLATSFAAAIASAESAALERMKNNATGRRRR